MDSLEGQVIGNYRIEALLGSGGMGEVYRGTHTLLNRPAAVKVMRQALAADPTFQARFRQEARSAATLSDSHIVEVYDFGEQAGRYYLVFELVPDGSLRSFLRRRAAGQGWPLALGIDLARQAAEGLAHAHRQGIIHRDIKPDNLLLKQLAAPSEPRERFALKISDFGLARLAEGGGLTSTGTQLGTPTYMSPEQCQGGHLDQRSDIYSLGAVLYEIATGYVPFTAINFVDASYHHVHTPPRPPRELKPDVPPDLDAIILRCLAKRPEQRYASADELARALAEAAAGANTRGTTVVPLPPVDALGPVNAYDAGDALPPETPEPPYASILPRVYLFETDRTARRLVELTRGGLTLGTAADNDLVVESPGVSRHHLRLDWNDQQATVTDLGSTSGTLLAGGRLVPRAAQPWSENQAVRAGSIWLRLVPPAPDTARSPFDNVRRGDRLGLEHVAPPSGSSELVPMPARAGVAAPAQRLALCLDQDALTLTPGLPAVVTATLANSGDTVDHVEVTVRGVPAAWVRGVEQPVQLNPGARATMMLSIVVARASSNRAGTYPVRVRATSRANPGDSAEAPALWTLLPFRHDQMALPRKLARGQGSANFIVRLQNGGSTRSEYALDGEDDERVLTYEFAANPATLEPGETKEVALTVRVPERRREMAQTFSFHVIARIAGTDTQLVEAAQLSNEPLPRPAALPSANHDEGRSGDANPAQGHAAGNQGVALHPAVAPGARPPAASAQAAAASPASPAGGRHAGRSRAVWIVRPFRMGAVGFIGLGLVLVYQSDTSTPANFANPDARLAATVLGLLGVCVGLVVEITEGRGRRRSTVTGAILGGCVGLLVASAISLAGDALTLTLAALAGAILGWALGKVVQLIEKASGSAGCAFTIIRLLRAAADEVVVVLGGICWAFAVVGIVLVAGYDPLGLASILGVLSVALLTMVAMVAVPVLEFSRSGTNPRAGRRAPRGQMVHPISPDGRTWAR